MAIILRKTKLARLYRSYAQWPSAIWLLLPFCWLATPSRAQTVSYNAPITITQGGTYSGNYQSLASGTACVKIATSAPVILSGCTLSGAGNLVEASEGANLTIRNCTGQGLTPTVDGQAPGRFLDAYRPQSLVIEHNTFTQTSGIVVNRWSGTGLTGQTLTVRYNKVRNIDGRWRNGGSTRSSFLILNTVQQLAGVDISYNEVINTADQSLVEDNINFYNSSGTAQSAIRVHDNFVRGAYPYPATGTGYTGTGLTTDGDGNTLAGATGYIEADHNQFVGTGNAAMNLAAGHDVYYHDNRAVTSGTLPDGRRFNAGYAGLGVFNYYNMPTSVFFNNRVENNTVGYVHWGGTSPYQDRQDLSPGACAPCTGTTSLPNPITTATEDTEATTWQQKLAQAGLTVGPVAAAAATPVATGVVVNPGFEADGAAVGAPTGWRTLTGAGTDDNADYTEIYPGAHSGTYHATHYRPSAYEVYTYQTITGLANGTYTFSAWVKSSGGQPTAQLRARNYGGANLAASITATTNGQWAQVSLANIVVSNGQCEIGFYSNALANQWVYLDDVALTRQNTPPTVALTATASLTLGQAVALQATAADTDGTISKVAFYNGTTKLGEATASPYQLSWTPTAVGSYSLTATATDNGGATTTSAAVTVVVLAVPAVVAPASGTNLALNPGFEADGAAVGAPTGWRTLTGAGTDDNADYTEIYPGAHSGTYHATHYRPSAYEVYTYQTVTGLANGTYTFSAWVKSSGGQPTAQLRARNYGGANLAASLVATTNGQWAQVSLANIVVSNGQCEIGFYSNALANQWVYLDDVVFALQPVATVAANTVLNASFDDDQAAVQTPSRWTTQTGGTTQAYASYTEAYPGAHSGTYHGTHYRPESYEVYTYQVVSGLPAGTYALKAWVKSSGGQSTAQLQAKNYGGASLTANILATTSDWVQVSIAGIVVSNGQCEVGFYSKANGGQSIYFDDVELTKQSTTSTTAKASVASTALAATTSATPTLYPNPANAQATLTATFAQAGAATIVVTTMQGTTVASYQQPAQAGENQFVLNTSTLPAGLYIVQLKGSQNFSKINLEVKH